MYEWLPWNRGILDQVPSDDRERRRWLAEWRSPRDAELADRCRELTGPDHREMPAAVAVRARRDQFGDRRQRERAAGEVPAECDDVIRRLRQNGLDCIVQVNIRDPDGNHIHIDFDAAEAEGVET
ncbi:MAG: hypothetical protein IH993_07665 [Proteobacteria bacterium]|nr:hypothetical protein [Pseudomonadota bacterium]